MFIKRKMISGVLINILYAKIPGKKIIYLTFSKFHDFLNYSKTCLKPTFSKADTCLERTKDFAPKCQYAGQNLINTT